MSDKDLRLAKFFGCLDSLADPQCCNACSWMQYATETDQKLLVYSFSIEFSGIRMTRPLESSRMGFI
jgi:hypothetical protein